MTNCGVQLKNLLKLNYPAHRLLETHHCVPFENGSLNQVSNVDVSAENWRGECNVCTFLLVLQSSIHTGHSIGTCTGAGASHWKVKNVSSEQKSAQSGSWTRDLSCQPIVGAHPIKFQSSIPKHLFGVGPGRMQSQLMSITSIIYRGWRTSLLGHGPYRLCD